MGDEQKEIVRIESFWIDTWLRSQYKGLETRYIVHDAVAKEVDQHTFFHLRESGRHDDLLGLRARATRSSTRASPPSDWNIYPFHFSDGDNWRQPTTPRRCMELLKRDLLPQAEPVLLRPGRAPPTAAASSRRTSTRPSPDEPGVVTSEIRDKDEIYDAIKDFLGKGQVMAAMADSRRPRRAAATRSRATRASTGSTSSTSSSRCSTTTQMNEVAAYGGFPTRYPHWRFGMEYEQLSQELRLRAVQDLRDGDQQRPRLRLPA